MSNKKDDDKNFSRRKFLQGGAVLGATIGVAAISDKKAADNVVKAIGVKELDEFPHKLSPDFKRFDGRVSNPIVYEAMGHQIGTMQTETTFGHNIDDNRPGFTLLDHALSYGAFMVEEEFGSKHYLSNSPMYSWELKCPHDRGRYEFASKEDASKAIKKAAKVYGADLVGITAYDEKWVYDPIMSFDNPDNINIPNFYTENDFPFKPKSVIVLAFEEDYELMSTAPSSLVDVTGHFIYSKMAEVCFKLAHFITYMGYKAFGTGNEVAESVPLAIAAGLGEQGRSSILITYEYGPRIRLAKVFTDMELAYDKPIEFGANKFCQVCKKCAECCPSQSISYKDEMTFTSEFTHDGLVLNHEGVEKYYYNRLTCSGYFLESGTGCGVCVTVCPFSKPDFWHHRLTTALTATPLKPFLKEMDDLFGYGDVFNEKACVDFWDLDSYANVKK